MTTRREATTNAARLATYAVLVFAPAVSYFVPAVLTNYMPEPSDIPHDPGGFFSFLFLLLNPYVGLAVLVALLSRTPVRAFMLLFASLIIGGAGAFLWYDLLVSETLILNILVLISVVQLQWFAIIATTIVTVVVWAVEKRLARRGSIGILVLGAALAIGCGDAPNPSPVEPPDRQPPARAREFRPESIVRGLPWQFVVTTEESDLGRTIRYDYVSVEPVDGSQTAKTFLRASVVLTSFPTADLAASAFADVAESAHPDTGLSYAWDYLVLDEPRILDLHAECLFSEEEFTVICGNLTEWVGDDPDQVIRCRCGDGCETTAGG